MNPQHVSSALLCAIVFGCAASDGAVDGGGDAGAVDGGLDAGAPADAGAIPVATPMVLKQTGQTSEWPIVLLSGSEGGLDLMSLIVSPTDNHQWPHFLRLSATGAVEKDWVLESVAGLGEALFLVALEDHLIAILRNHGLHGLAGPDPAHLHVLPEPIVDNESERVWKSPGAGKECVDDFPRTSVWV